MAIDHNQVTLIGDCTEIIVVLLNPDDTLW